MANAPMAEEIQRRRVLMHSWLSLADLVDMYNRDVKARDNGETAVMDRRANAIAAFRSVEDELGMPQSIPRRVR